MEPTMTPAKFETQVLKIIAGRLDSGMRAEFDNGTLFVTGAMPDEGREIRALLKSAGHRVRMSVAGSYQTDYTFVYDFVA
jgi:hypothetical protein